MIYGFYGVFLPPAPLLAFILDDLWFLRCFPPFSSPTLPQLSPFSIHTWWFMVFTVVPLVPSRFHGMLNAAAQEEIIREFKSPRNNYCCRSYFQYIRLPPHELFGLLWIVFISLIILNRSLGKGVPLERLISRALLEDLLINPWSPARASILKIGACSGPHIWYS